jgi:hypothetical protein
MVPGPFHYHCHFAFDAHSVILFFTDGQYLISYFCCSGVKLLKHCKQLKEDYFQAEKQKKIMLEAIDNIVEVCYDPHLIPE